MNQITPPTTNAATGTSRRRAERSSAAGRSEVSRPRAIQYCIGIQPWHKAMQSVETSQRTLETAQRALGEATAKADQVRRQIEAACPQLGLDPAEVMGMAEDPTEQSRTAIQAPRVDYGGPRAHYEERVIDLLSDGRLVAGEQLRTTHHGQEHFARVESDGSISGVEHRLKVDAVGGRTRAG